MLTQYKTTGGELNNELIKALSTISETVSNVFCFGGNNKSSAKKVAEMLSELTKRAYTHKKTLEQMQLSQQTEKLTGISLQKWPEYFHDFQGQTYINPAFFKKNLEKQIDFYREKNTQKDLPEEVRDWFDVIETLSKCDALDLQSNMAFFTYYWVTRVKNKAQFFKNREAEIKLGSECVAERKEPTNKKNRELFIQYTANDLKFAAFYFGMGNCQLMAELAFLLSIQNLKKTPFTPIRYIQFHHQENRFEELNAVVIGHWPKKGCQILAPWYSKSPFEWQGTLADTPELNHYDTISTFFTVQNKEEQDRIDTQLKELGFEISKLLNSDDRKNYLQYIGKISSDLHTMTQNAVKNNTRSTNKA